MKQAIAYVRVSTEDQYASGYGREAQKRDIQSFADKAGYSIARWVEEEKGVSGADPSPPALVDIIYDRGVMNPPYEALIIARTDRISRVTAHYYHYKHMLTRKDVKIISATENFSAFGEDGDLLENIIVGMAQLERRNIAKRTAGGRKVKASMGGYAGGRAPYGYEVDRGRLVINEEEAQAVRRMFELRDRGMTYKEVEEILNGEGYRRRNGNPFHYSGIQQMISNRRTYEGEYKYGKDGEWVEGQHEAILDRRSDGE